MENALLQDLTPFSHKSSRIGIWRRSRHRTTRSTAKSIGERSKQRFKRAAGVALRPRQTESRLAFSGLTTQRLRPPRLVLSAVLLPTKSMPYFASYG